MKELILQALSRFLYKLRGLFVEKTELKKYAKKPNKRYIVGRAMALHPMVGDRYFFQTGMVKMRVDKAFVQALAENTQMGMNYISISGNDSQQHSLQELLAEAEAYEQAQAGKRYPKKWKGVMVIYKTTATIKSTLLLSYRDGCSIDTLTEAVRNGSGELKDIVEGQVWMNNAKELTTETTCKDLHIKAGRVTCTKMCGIQEGTWITQVFQSFRESTNAARDRKDIYKDTKKRIIRTKRRAFKTNGGIKYKLQRVRCRADEHKKVVITPFCKGRKGIPEWFYLENFILHKSAIR